MITLIGIGIIGGILVGSTLLFLRTGRLDREIRAQEQDGRSER